MKKERPEAETRNKYEKGIEIEEKTHRKEKKKENTIVET